MYILYQHTNILNSKVYIGITKYSNPNKRWLNGKGYRKDSLFYKARNKIAQANLGKKCTVETKQKIGDANRGQNNGMYGKDVSNLFKKQVSERFSKGVIQYSLDGVFIQEFKSATEAQQFLHLKINHIGCCCKGNRKTCGGYIWKYK